MYSWSLPMSTGCVTIDTLLSSRIFYLRYSIIRYDFFSFHVALMTSYVFIICYDTMAQTWQDILKISDCGFWIFEGVVLNIESRFHQSCSSIEVSSKILLLWSLKLYPAIASRIRWFFSSHNSKHLSYREP